MFIHLWDVHPDFIPPPPYDRMFDPDYTGSVTSRDFLFSSEVTAATPKRDIEHIIALYDGEIAWTDLHVGKILDDLDSSKLRDNTIVMLLSDHGEEFFEHGSKGHRHTLFGELIHIPLIIRYPGHIPAGRRFSEQVRMIDVTPTLVELAGAPPPTDVMGQSLVPLLNGGSLRADNLAVSELYSLGRRLRSFRRPDRKMIFDENAKKAFFFDLRDDPGEIKGLSDLSNPLVQAMLREAQDMTRRLIEFRDRMNTAAVPAELPSKVRDRLRSLGYVGADPENLATSQGAPQQEQPQTPP